MNDSLAWLHRVADKREIWNGRDRILRALIAVAEVVVAKNCICANPAIGKHIEHDDMCILLTRMLARLQGTRPLAAFEIDEVLP